MSPTPSIPTSTCFPSPTSPLSPIILPSTSKHLNIMVSTSTTTPPFNKSASSSPSPPPPTSTPTSISTKKPTLTTAPLPPSTMTKPLSPTSLSPCSRDVAPRIMSVPVAQISTSPIITSTVPNINSEGASTTSTAAHGRRSRSRSRNASTSTPPPSPPLSASDTAHKEGQNGAFDTHTRQRNTPHHHQQRNRRYNHHLTSVEVSTAAAAAAAASYTSQELAIAYSMVTSSVQETDEEGESKAATTTDQGSPKQQAKLDQIQSSTDSSDSLSTLWKKSAPLQEPYFQTRHTIASQHTLSTLDGVLFSLDEEPKEFNEGMYIAMRNRIFELEAKTVNYAPFNRSRKRSIDRSMDEYPGYGYGHGYDHAHQGRPPVHSGYDGEYGHSFKRAAYHHPHHPHRHSPPSPAYGPPRPEDRQNIYRYAPSYPSWYTPETYMSGSQPQHPGSKHVPTRAGDRELASSHSQVEHRNSRDSNGHDSGGPLSSPPRTLATKPQTVQPRPILPHRGAEAGGPTKMHHSPGSQPNRQSPPSHPSSTQYTHASPQSTEQPPTSTTPSQQQQLQQQQQEQQRQSFQQRQHRAQQQAQSDYSRSYHLQKHMRMLDQQRTLKLAQQQQQQQQQQQAQQPVKIQRQYQPHQQMYPHSSSNQASSTQSQLSLQQQQQQQQHQASRMLAIHHHQQQQQSAQQQLIQRYQAQRLLQQKQQQARQLQELRQRATIAQSISTGTTLAAMKAQSLARGNSTSSSNGGVAATNSIEGGGPRQKSARPLECSNCMALDSLTWRPRVESGASSTTSTQDPPATAAEPTSDSTNSKAEGRLLCPACIQYWQAHGKCRPVPPFRVNFLKKIHSRFKKELQEVRFQGWQDAQVLEVEDRMTELDWKRVFSAASSFDEADANVRSSQTSISSTAASSPVIHPAKTATPVSTAGTMEEGPIVIKIEDDDDDVSAIGSQQSLFSSGSTVATSSLPSSEVRTFMSEAAVGEVFGQRWKTEPMVGYTLVHFGGSDRTRMVPMNPTVPSLTVTFSRATESVVFAFRVLVNGLCLLSSGGGPPALHMPEMEEDEEESDEECDQDQDTPERDSREDKAEDEGEGEDVEMESAPWPDDLTPASSSLLSSSSAVGGAAGVTATTTTVID